MVVKYCVQCPGQPYTTDLSMAECPVCHQPLQIKFAEESELAQSPQLGSVTTPADEPEELAEENTAQTPLFFKPKPTQDDKDNFWQQVTQEATVPEAEPSEALRRPDDAALQKPEKPQKPQSFPTPTRQERPVRSEKGEVVIRGRVSQYSCTGGEGGGYRRLFFTKWYQALVYHQRMEDLLHRFTVRTNEGADEFGHTEHANIPVNVHGTISGGMQIVDNSFVEVRGTYRNGVLMARSISVVDNGYHTPVTFQRSVRAIVCGVLAAIALLFFLFVGFSSDGFFDNLRHFGLIWLTTAVILAVLCLLLLFSRIGILFWGRKFPLVPIVILSFILTLVYIQLQGGFAML